MKRIFWCIVAAVALIACSQNGVDSRDQLVGEYNCVSEGQIGFNIMQEHYEIPLNGEGVVSISKAIEKNKVQIEMFNDSIVGATFNGKELRLDEDRYSIEIQGYGADVEVLNDRIQFADPNLTWETDIEATLKYNGMGFIGKGHLSITGTRIVENE